MSQSNSTRVSYFGKFPARGDFVKNGVHPQLLDTLDTWVADAMEQLAEDPRWKPLYDAAQPMHFAFLGSRSRLAIAGHLVPSQDASSRRFPFLTAAPIEVAQPLEFIGRSPMAFGRLWSQLSATTQAVIHSDDYSKALQTLDELEPEIHANADEGFSNFIELQTLERIQRMLAQTGHQTQMNEIVLALGLLLEPVMSGGSSYLEKGLILPLPDDPLYRNLQASFWMTLIAPFLARADFELSLFIGNIDGRERLVIGFRGASSTTLCNLFVPQALQARNIVLDEAPWVQEHIGSSPGLAKLASYLDQPQLSLRRTLNTFREVFIGA